MVTVPDRGLWVVGFTGTHLGMTQRQLKEVSETVRLAVQRKSKIQFHHGDCTGADLEFHEIVSNLRKSLHYKGAHISIHIHPPVDPKARAWCSIEEAYGDKIYPEKPYLERDDDIAAACDILLAAPASDTEVLRSGTWATIRRARKRGKQIVRYPR